MTEKEIAQWLRNAYEKSLRDGSKSYDSDISRTQGTQGQIILLTGGKNYLISKNTLADELGDDELASKIWTWIHP